MRSVLSPVAAAILLSAILCGCGDSGGPSLYPVKGKLTKGGQPLAGVSVTFTSVDKSFSAGGLTNASGEFVLVSQTGKAGTVAGKHKVVLSELKAASETVVDMTNPATRDKMMQQRQGTMQGGASGAPKAEDASKTIPAEYMDPEKTPLEYTVNAGSNDFDIVIP